MKKLLCIAVSFLLGSFYINAMEKVPENGMKISLKLEGIPSTISLQKVLSHISNYQILTDPVTGEICVKGFHWYGNAAEKIDLGNGATLCKLTSALWVVTLGDIYSFHTGYVIYRGKVCKAPKTFFPCNWNSGDIVRYIKGMHQESELQVKERKEHTSESYKVYRVKMIPFPASSLTTPLRLFVLGCPGVKESMHILTVYPEIKPTEYSLANLESFALQQVKGLKEIKKVERNPELIQAIEEGNLAKVITLLEGGADPNIKNERGISPLMVSAKVGDWNLVNILLEYGASKTARDEKNSTVLHYAVHSGDFYCVLGLICQETINAQSHEGITPLMLAVMNKHVDIVSLLLQWHVKLNEKDSFGRTALIHAVTQVDPKGALLYKAMVELLLKYGAEVDAQDKAGNTALIHAALHNKTPLVELLLNAHADYTLKNSKGDSAVSLARKNIDQSLFKCIEHVIERKNAWIKDYEANELLYAAYSNNTLQVKQLLASHDVNEQDNMGRTALFFAVDNNNLELVQLLLQKGANPCFQTHHTQTIDSYVHHNPKILSSIKMVIKQAAYQYHIVLKEEREKEKEERQRKFVLLHSHIVKNDVSKVPLEIISQFNNQLLSKDGCTPLLYAVRERKYNAAHQLLDLGASAQAEDNNKRDALGIALNNKDTEMVSLLMTSGKVKVASIEQNFNSALTNKNYASARLIAQKASQTIYSFLCKVITRHEVSTLELILQEHIIELTIEQLGRLLFEAVQSLDESMVKVVLKYCASSIDWAYQRGETALIRAVRLKCYRIVELLSHAGANIHIKDEDGSSALDYAKYDARLCAILQAPEKRKKEEALQAQQLQNRERTQKKLEEVGYSPLMIAVHFGEKEAVKQNNDDVNACDTLKRTALMIAVYQGASDIAHELLAKQGIKINQVDKSDNTALMYAMKYKRYEIAQALIAAGAAVCFINKNGESIIQFLEIPEVPPFLKDSAKQKLRQELFTYITLGTQISSAEKIESYFNKFKLHLNKLHDDDKIYVINQVIGLKRADILKMLLSLMPYPKGKREKALLDPLEYAVQCGDPAIIAILLNYYPVISSEIVRSAIEAEKLSLAQLLLHTGAVQMNDENITEIFTALSSHDKEAVVMPLFLSRYIKDVSQPYCEVYLLTIACQAGNKKAVKLLLSAGANIDQVDFENWAPLLDAANTGNRGIVSLLLKRGAHVDTRDEENSTALMHAAEQGHAEVVAALIKGGADIHATNAKGISALSWATFNNYPDIIHQLVRAGVPVDTKVGDGHTALLIAAQQGCIGTVKLLLSLGARVNHACDHGHTALLLAALSGHKEVVKTLFEAGADLDGGYREGIDIPHIFSATYPKSARVFRELLLSDSIKIDITRKDSINFFCLACAAGEVEIVKYFLNKGIAVNVRDILGMTPFRYACDKGDVQIVELLLKAGASTDAQDEAGLTPLAKACAIGRTNIVRLLLAFEVDVNTSVRLRTHTIKMTHTTQVPAHVFLNPKEIEPAHVFLNPEEGEVVCVVHESDTPLMIACYNNHKEIVQLLLSTGKIDLDRKNKQGKSVFDIIKKGAFNGGMALTFNSDTKRVAFERKDKKLYLRQMDVRAREIKKIVLEYVKKAAEQASK